MKKLLTTALITSALLGLFITINIAVAENPDEKCKIISSKMIPKEGELSYLAYNNQYNAAKFRLIVTSENCENQALYFSIETYGWFQGFLMPINTAADLQELSSSTGFDLVTPINTAADLQDVSVEENYILTYTPQYSRDKAIIDLIFPMYYSHQPISGLQVIKKYLLNTYIADNQNTDLEIGNLKLKKMESEIFWVYCPSELDEDICGNAFMSGNGEGGVEITTAKYPPHNTSVINADIPIQVSDIEVTNLEDNNSSLILAETKNKDLCRTEEVIQYMESLEIDTGNKLNCYNSLAPLPFVNTKTDINNDGKPDFILLNIDIDKDGKYDSQVYIGTIHIGYMVNSLFKLLIGIAGIASILAMIAFGIKYMTTSSATNILSIKERLQNIFVGILILLSASIILTTINPRLSNIYPEFFRKGGIDGLYFTQGDPIKIYYTNTSTGEGTYIMSSPACSSAFIEKTTFLGKTVQINQMIIPNLKKAEEEIINYMNENNADYPIKTIYGYNCRKVVTLGGESNKYSAHAYGLAIDINHRKNQLQKINKNDPNDFETDMPDWFIDIMVKYGFGWGGDWESKKDPMHYSFMCKEQRATMLKRKNIELDC